MKTELNIAFLTSADPRDRKSWSGIYFQMMNSLEQQFTNVVPLGPVEVNKKRLSLITYINVATYILTSRRYNIVHTRLLCRYFAPIFRKKLKEAKFDLIFAPSSSVEIAHLKTDIPICYYSDTSFNQINGYYDFFSNLSKFSVRESESIQSKALKKSDIIIHSSKWASDHVVKHYGIEEKKAFTVAMGANIDEPPDAELIGSKISNKVICNLLLIGVEWERKGGSIAFGAMVALNELGLDTTLTICGCVPPGEFAHPKMRVIPFLDKNNKMQYDYFSRLLYSTHFLILPTRAECAGIVFAEASAFGIPSITTDTGGVASMVENGVNGMRLPFEAGAADYARVIKSIFEDNDLYKKLVYSSRAKYDNELNWKVWGEKVKEIIQKNYKKN
jgi:glycosyltransferase involved in cell wall biosynthesis